MAMAGLVFACVVTVIMLYSVLRRWEWNDADP